MFEIILFIIFVLVGGTFAYAGLRGAPWLPTKARDIERIFSTVEIKPGQTFYDLGCGDGRLLFLAAEKGAFGIGYEISFLPYLIAQVRRIFSKQRKKIKIHFRDFWNADLRDADVVYLFAQPQYMEKLKLKLEREMKPGSVALSYCWSVDGLGNERKIEAQNRLPFYVYKI